MSKSGSACGLRQMTTNMTHSELVERAVKWLKAFGCGVVLDDRFKAITSTGEQPDALGLRSYSSILIECKATRSDFLADKKKKFRQDPALGVGDWRFYFCPPGLIQPNELPEGWGLLYCYPKTVKKVHGIPSNSVLETEKPFKGCAANERRIIYSALRRAKG